MSGRTPFDGIDELFDRLDREMGDVGRVFDTGVGESVNVDVVERDDEVVVAADLPGFERDEIEIAASGSRLTISAEDDEATETDETDDRGTYHRRERRSRSVTRRLRLPVEVDEEAASATYENGVLTVTLPKRELSLDEGTRIDVEDGE